MAVIFLCIIIIIIIVTISFLIASFSLGSKIHSTAKFITSIQNDEPEPLSVGGATDLYLERIRKDFPEYHYLETQFALAGFIHEYLSYKYNHGKFTESNIDPLLPSIIERDSQNSPAYNIKVNHSSIYDYQKNEEYATVVFLVSVGFTRNEKRIETRYRVHHTFQLTHEGIASKAMTCNHCGASIEDTNIGVCPYCDSKIIRDTIMSWKFSYIKENNL